MLYPEKCGGLSKLVFVFLLIETILMISLGICMIVVYIYLKKF
jgi:hypothetical protein